MELLKYPRTKHIQGSRLQVQDEDLDTVAFTEIAGRHLVIEEKMDGANSAISFDENANLLLQSRGHYLSGGAREKHFHLFKQWAATHSQSLLKILGKRFICYGEWLYAKHTIFYDQLPHYFLEFDIFDRENKIFLDTKTRQSLLQGSVVSSVSVLFSGCQKSLKEMSRLLGDSSFISKNHKDLLSQQAKKLGISEELARKESDPTGLMEGLYIKVEEDGVVKERYKFIRKSFLTQVLESESHWLERPILPNLLADGVDIYAG